MEDHPSSFQKNQDTSEQLCIQEGQSEENIKVPFWQQAKWTVQTEVMTEVDRNPEELPCEGY